ncbi:MAG TPA: endonuclease/exonuclease/phosphatase family protein [Solirubrobacteraceae bacterium]|nr:endonuclease/exonuclease/phosphatase family protein [Solirubrobacteraceae bacterium]
MRVLTWNAFGGSTAALAAALTANNIDLCVLQEAQVNPASPWYAPLAGLAGYVLTPSVRENVCHALPGGTLYPADSQVRAYAIVRRTATIPAPPEVKLVDYTTDGVWGPKTPTDPFKAAQAGYNQRPPLRIKFPFGGFMTTLFTWHAPQVAIWNPLAVSMFDQSKALADAVAQRAVIAGDLNTKSVAGHFGAFAGVQQQDTKIDYVLANTTLANVSEIPGINLQAGSHWALAADVTW